MIEKELGLLLTQLRTAKSSEINREYVKHIIELIKEIIRIRNGVKDFLADNSKSTLMMGNEDGLTLVSTEDIEMLRKLIDGEEPSLSRPVELSDWKRRKTP